MRNTNRVGVSVQFDREQKEKLTYLFSLHGLTFSAGLRLLGYEYLEQNKKLLENYTTDEQKQVQAHNFQNKANNLNKLLNFNGNDSNKAKSDRISESLSDTTQAEATINSRNHLQLYDANGNYMGLDTDIYSSQEDGSLVYSKTGTPLGNFKNHKFDPYPNVSQNVKD